jgi:hypothetical protein
MKSKTYNILVEQMAGMSQDILQDAIVSYLQSSNSIKKAKYNATFIATTTKDTNDNLPTLNIERQEELFSKPDPIELKLFCQELFKILKSQGIDVTKYGSMPMSFIQLLDNSFNSPENSYETEVKVNIAKINQPSKKISFTEPADVKLKLDGDFIIFDYDERNLIPSFWKRVSKEL